MQAAPSASDGAADAATTVVIVDDDASFRGLANRLVSSWGYAVVGEAGTVAEALAKVAELQPDTVLADIGLPDGDGFMLTSRLVELPSAPRVVLISTDADPSNHGAAARVGADGFVPKHALAGRALRDLMAA